MRPLFTAILTGCLLLNTACIRARTTPDFRPQTGLSAVAQPLPVRLERIHTASRVNLSNITQEQPCYEANAQGAYVLAPCSKPEDIERRNALITQPLHTALRDTFAQTRLFSNTAAKSVVLNAIILSFEMREGVINKGNLRIRYEFIDGDNGQVLLTADMDSTAREVVVSPIDMGQSYDDAMTQTVQRNIVKLLQYLQDSKHNAVFFTLSAS